MVPSTSQLNKLPLLTPSRRFVTKDRLIMSDPEDDRPGDTVLRVVDAERAGVRVDQFLVREFPQFSRTSVRRAIDRGAVRIDGVTVKASHILKSGHRIQFEIPEPPRTGPAAEEIPLEFLYLDEAIAVVNKPAGMVVHPAKGNWQGTLAGALKWHLESGGLSTVGGPVRPGIVHRLDRDTSGVIIVARSEESHHKLAKQFESRSVEKTYLAITQGQPDLDRDEIDLPIGIHPYQREKMAVRRDHPTSRSAQTRFEVLERFWKSALVRLSPKTGRTHQLRVHLAAIGSPVLGDALYSGRRGVPAGFYGDPPDGPPLLGRQALHAAKLSIQHPFSGEAMTFEAPLPEDMQNLLTILRTFGKSRDS